MPADHCLELLESMSILTQHDTNTNSKRSHLRTGGSRTGVALLDGLGLRVTLSSVDGIA